MKRILVAALLVLIPAAVWAAPLRGVRADPATIGCVFDPTCVISDIVDSADKLDLPGASTGGLLHTRTFPGKPGSPAEGLHVYLYRIDLTNARGNQTTPMVQTFTLDFGKAVPLDYDGDGTKEDYFTVDFAGTAGGMAPDYGDQTQYRTSFHFYDSVPVGQSSMFIGMAASGAPVSKSARVTEGLSALLVDPGIFLPFFDPCDYRRPDLNDDFSPAERDVLDDLVLDYIDACVIGVHYTPGIHLAPLLPWHRTYIDGLENYLISQGHPEFVPFPKWVASNPIPAEFQDIDPSCTTADTAVCTQNAPAEGPGDCAPLADTTPNTVKPASIIYPDLCDFEDATALRNGVVGYHNAVHCDVGGAMCSFHSPSANIFWGHHGNVDDIWLEWECRCNGLVSFPIDYLPFDILTPCRLVPCWATWYRFEDPYIFDPMGTMPPKFGDLRGAPNDGIPEGTPATIAGQVGTAMRFDGVDDFVRVPDHPELNVGTEDMAIDLWAMTMAMGRQPLVEKLDDAGAGFSFFLQNGMPAFEMKPMVAATESPMVGAIGPNTVADGKWHHLAVSVDRDSSIGGRLFVDGVAVATFDPMPAQGSIGNSSEMWIGRSRSMAGARAGTFFAGALDEMDLFRRALKPLEVAGVFQAGPAGKPGALPLQTPITVREICNGRAIGEPGTRVSVPITLDDGDGVAGFQVDLNYDPGVLTPVAVMLGADTALAGGWSVVMAPVGPGVLRILGESNPPVGLGPGPKEMALVQFDVAAGAPAGQSLLSETNCVLGDKDGSGILCRPCANPGVVIVRDASTFRFRPLPALVGVDAFDPLPFMAMVEALDSSGNIATGYGRTAMMSLAAGLCPADTLLPATLPFVSGLGGPDTFRVFCCPEYASGFPLALMASDPPLEITGTSDPTVGISKGDLDANGQADVLDVLRDVRLALGQSVTQPPPTAFQMWAGDMLDEHCLADRSNNVLDVLRVRNKSLGRPFLCPCGGPFAMDMLTVLAAPQAPLGVRLEKTGPRSYLVIVEGARDLGGLQFEIKGASPETVVTPEGLATGRGWQVFTDAGHANLMRVVAFGNATGGITGDGAVLKITGAGSPKIRLVVASDQDGREVKVR